MLLDLFAAVWAVYYVGGEAVSAVGTELGRSRGFRVNLGWWNISVVGSVGLRGPNNSHNASDEGKQETDKETSKAAHPAEQREDNYDYAPSYVL